MNRKLNYLLLFIGINVLMACNSDKESKNSVPNPLSVQERLGYGKEEKLLIIHADDIGMTHSENMASIQAFEKGGINSGSIMVPCPWFLEIADYGKKHPDFDLGVHLTLTSEWKYYRWAPVLPYSKVSSLVDSINYMHKGYAGILNTAQLDEIEKEMRAQIDRALAAGIDVTHLDSHMGTLFLKPELIQLYMKLGKEYKLPILLDKKFIPMFNNVDVEKLLTGNEILADRIYIANPENNKQGLNNFYAQTLSSLQPGFNVMLIHAAHDNDEMQGVCIEHPDWGSEWREQDYSFFVSDTCKQLLKQNNIRLVTWKEIRDKLLRTN